MSGIKWGLYPGELPLSDDLDLSTLWGMRRYELATRGLNESDLTYFADWFLREWYYADPGRAEEIEELAANVERYYDIPMMDTMRAEATDVGLQRIFGLDSEMAHQIRNRIWPTAEGYGQQDDIEDMGTLSEQGLPMPSAIYRPTFPIAPGSQTEQILNQPMRYINKPPRLSPPGGPPPGW